MVRATGISMPIVSRVEGDSGPAPPGMAPQGRSGKTKALVAVFAAAALVGAIVGLTTDTQGDQSVLLAEGDEDAYSVYGQPSASPTESTVVTFAPSSAPSDTPTPAPQNPSASPVAAPTESPVDAETTTSPTGSPTTKEPTSSPTTSPSAAPSTSPTVSPSKSPIQVGSPTSSPVTASPSTSPTASPTSAPTASPTSAPTASPTAAPSASPTSAPSTSPTTSPSTTPTTTPTTSPTTMPTTSPTTMPTVSPTWSPTKPDETRFPTGSPVVSPTGSPTNSPSVSPTSSPQAVGATNSPTKSPFWPTSSPTKSPNWPTSAPTSSPTSFPTVSPSVSPTSAPTTSPTDAPVEGGNFHPPSSSPIASPTPSPSARPVGWPDRGNNAQPTSSPTFSVDGADNSFPPTGAPVISDGNEELDCPNLGIPAKYNGFFCGHYTNMNPGGDVDGRLAVRGNFKASEYSVVTNLEPDVDPHTCVANDFGVVIGGDAEFEHGAKFSLAYAIQGAYTGSGFDAPDCVDNRVGSLPEGWDFATMCADLAFESQVLASDAYLPSSFVRNITYGSGWVEGADNWRANFLQIPIDSRFAVNVINIPAEVDMARVHSTRFIEIDHEAGEDILRAVIINYRQPDLEWGGSFKWNGETMDETTPLINRRIMLNKPTEGTIKITNGFPFSILAPTSDVSPYTTGVIRGQLFARNYVSEDVPGQNPFISLQWNPFTCEPVGETAPPTPKPTMSPLSQPTPLPTPDPDSPPTQPPSGPICPDMSDVARYNMFVCGDMTNNVAGSDVQGRVAIGGDLFARQWSVGKQLPGDEGVCVADDFSVVVRGDVDWVGRKYSRAGAVGGTVAVDESESSPVFDPECADNTNELADVEALINFDDVCDSIAQESARLADWAWQASLPNDNTVTVSDSLYYGGVTADEITEAADAWKLKQIELPIDFEASVNIINVRADMRIGNEINTIRFVEGANPQPETGFVPVIIVNIHSDSVEIDGAFQFLGESLTNTSDMAEEILSKIIFNMPMAQSLYIGTSVPGSILSPDASVVEGSNGVVRGNWIVGEYVSTDAKSFVQVNLPTFMCDV